MVCTKKETEFCQPGQSVWKNSYLPLTVMLNWHIPSRGTESLALQVTVVKPAGNLSPDLTTVPESSEHTMLVELMGPSTVSLAVGIGIQLTTAFGIPGSTFIIGTVFGQLTVGG